MDLGLTGDQQLVQSTARQFLEHESPMARVRALVDDGADFDRELWKRAGNLGWFAPFVAEEDGGGSVSGAPVADAAILVEEAGRAILPGPLVPANVVAFAIAREGSPEQRAAHLPGLLDGSNVTTWGSRSRAGDGTRGASSWRPLGPTTAGCSPA